MDILMVYYDKGDNKDVSCLMVGRPYKDKCDKLDFDDTYYLYGDEADVMYKIIENGKKYMDMRSDT